MQVKNDSFEMVYSKNFEFTIHFFSFFAVGQIMTYNPNDYFGE